MRGSAYALLTAEFSPIGHSKGGDSCQQGSVAAQTRSHRGSGHELHYSACAHGLPADPRGYRVVRIYRQTNKP